jgi:hypothetical protein
MVRGRGEREVGRRTGETCGCVLSPNHSHTGGYSRRSTCARPWTDSTPHHHRFWTDFTLTNWKKKKKKMEGAVKRKFTARMARRLNEVSDYSARDEKRTLELMKRMEDRLVQWFQDETDTLEISVGWFSRFYYRRVHVEQAAERLCSKYKARLDAIVVCSGSKVIFWIGGGGSHSSPACKGRDTAILLY